MAIIYDGGCRIDNRAISEVTLVCDLCGKLIRRGEFYLEVKDESGSTQSHRFCPE